MASIAALILLGLLSLAYRSRSPQASHDDRECLVFARTHATRHMRRHRARQLQSLVEELPEKAAAVQSTTDAAAVQRTLLEARCLLRIRRDSGLTSALASAEPRMLFPAALTNGSAVGRRLAVRRSRAADSTRRVTRGLGIFAGADFACDADRDAFVGAPWARGACLIKCAPGSTAAVPRCPKATAVCERLAACTTVDINVEGSVATLKSETELSGRTSRVKQVTVRNLRGRPGPASPGQQRMHGVDGACAEHEVAVAELAGRPACVLDCPKLNCTRGVERCFATPTCVTVDISFSVPGHSAVARLRYQGQGVARRRRQH